MQLTSQPMGQPKAVLVAAVLAVLFSSAYFAAEEFKPRKMLADQMPAFTLESAIPESFGEWRNDKSIAPVIANPQTEEALNTIYSQTVSRTYINRDGARVMLSIAYGKDQSDALKVHFPEVCYSAQGFAIKKKEASTVTFKQEHPPLPSVHLVAQVGNRIEPITYWVAVGEKVANNKLQQKATQLSYGVTGVVPDGFLIRTSTIDGDEKRSFGVQQEFIAALYQAVDPGVKTRMFPAM